MHIHIADMEHPVRDRELLPPCPQGDAQGISMQSGLTAVPPPRDDAYRGCKGLASPPSRKRMNNNYPRERASAIVARPRTSAVGLPRREGMCVYICIRATIYLRSGIV